MINKENNGLIQITLPKELINAIDEYINMLKKNHTDQKRLADLKDVTIK